MSSSSGISKEKEEKLEALAKEIRELQNNASQLTEVEDVERNKTFKLVEQMKSLQTRTGVTVPISTDVFGPAMGEVKDTSIGANAVVMGMDSDGKSFSRPLLEFPPVIVFNVVAEWVPKLKESVAAKKSEVEERLYAVEKLLREFDSGSPRSGAEGKKPSGDLVRSQMNR